MNIIVKTDTGPDCSWITRLRLPGSITVEFGFDNAYCIRPYQLILTVRTISRPDPSTA
jgi:hypothetical protein